MLRYSNKFVLFLLIIFHLLNFLFWLNREVWPVGKDWNLHLANAYAMMANLNNNFSIRNLVFVDIAHPPFYYWAAITLKNICFNNYKYIFLTSAVFFFILLFSIYGIGKQLKNKEVAILATILCSFTPIIYKSAIPFNLDLAATALLSMTVYNLLASKDFSKRKFSILSGVSLGLGLLTKQIVALFIIGPILTILLNNFKNCGFKIENLNKRKVSNFFLFLVVTFCIAFTFYHKPIIIDNIIGRMNVLGEAGSGSIFSWPHLSYYIKILPYQIGILGLVILIFCVYNFFSERRFAQMLLGSWIIVPFFVLTLSMAKFEEYALAYVPAIILIMAMSINNLKIKNLKNTIALLLIIFNICQYFREF